MPYLPLRKVPDSPSRGLATEWQSTIKSSLRDDSTDRSLLCREILTSLYYPQYANNWETAVGDASLAPATRLALVVLVLCFVSLVLVFFGVCVVARFLC